MENHPLNLAHHQHRRADAHLLNKKYDEAMHCHHNAAELLLDAMKSTTSSAALESITLQHSYHLKQKDLIKVKKDQYARVKKAMENIKWLSKDPLADLQSNDYTRLEIAIYKNINDTSSLLSFLNNKKVTTDVGIIKDTKSKDVTDGKRTEKTQELVIEELGTLSHNLQSLVEQLVMQVEVLKDDNICLKERLAYLEKERVKYLNLPSGYNDRIVWNSPISQPVDVPVLPATPKNVAAGSNAPTSQPTFDLSALKDD